MRICDNCGMEFEDFEEFCPECGAPIEEEPEEYYDDPNEHQKICPQCGDSIPLNADVCPYCGCVFRKTINKKKYIFIGAGAALAVVIVIMIILINRNNNQPIAIVSATEPPAVVTQAPAVDATLEPVTQPTAEPVQQSSATTTNLLDAYHDEVSTIFALLEPAAAGETAVNLTSPFGELKTVSVGTAETYINKLLSYVFGSTAGFDYSFYRNSDAVWHLDMGGTLNDDQMQKMLALEDSNIYATFRNMYLNSARQVITSALGVQPQITLSVYQAGRSGEDYALRIFETDAGNGIISRNENT